MAQLGASRLFSHKGPGLVKRGAFTSFRLEEFEVVDRLLGGISIGRIVGGEALKVQLATAE